MIYDYFTYYTLNCIGPLKRVSFLTLWIIVLFIQWRRKTIELKSVKKIIFPLLIWGALIVESAIPLLRGGIFLLKETPNDSVRLKGIVTDIIELPQFGGAKYDVEGHRWGEAIVMNDKTFYVMTCNDISIGDSVEMDVLPHSKFVLWMEKIKDNCP